ncbi:translation initiation factor 2 [Breoghania sp.]|uniref:translation initiation factor 2 n=1 Tax=Breoghania sp. TaxID=2065378 RepID=UPI00262EC494|nr:translation initiation factor 2 [Breoghania sp.]MDJ0932747.1 translation initiation factor 2 [Breoghania sp.]
MIFRIFAGLLLAGSVETCGPVTQGTSEQVSFHSSPSGAETETSLSMACTTPCTLDIPRKKAFAVTMSKEGYEPQTVQVKTKVSGGGAAGVTGNVLIGGVIGVDMATGAALNHAPNPVFVDFDKPENTSKPPKQPKAKPYKPQGPQPPVS